jgi:hypothetical protein
MGNMNRLLKLKQEIDDLDFYKKTLREFLKHEEAKINHKWWELTSQLKQECPHTETYFTNGYRDPEGYYVCKFCGKHV